MCRTGIYSKSRRPVGWWPFANQEDESVSGLGRPSVHSAGLHWLSGVRKRIGEKAGRKALDPAQATWTGNDGTMGFCKLKV